MRQKIGLLVMKETIFFAVFLFPYSALASLTSADFLDLFSFKTGCLPVFKENTSPSDEELAYLQLPQVTDAKAPLPEDTTRRILSHPKVRKLQTHYGTGARLRFDFAYMGMKQSHKGEYIQRVFLIKVIRTIFPQAEIITRGYDDRFREPPTSGWTLKAHVFLEIRDIREAIRIFPIGDMECFLMSHKCLVDMVLLKKANSSPKAISKKEYKDVFPFSETDKVLSLYLSEYVNGDIPKQPDHPELFRVLRAFLDRGFHRIFLTNRFITLLNESSSELHAKLSRIFDKVFFLSDLSVQDLAHIAPGERVIFLNNLVGYTPVLHSLADVTFIVGPVNMLEGIFLGARVLFMADERAFSSWYSSAFKDLKQTALATNRAVYMVDLEELDEALGKLDRLFLTKPVVYPDEVVLDPEKGNALEQLIERLYFQIEESAQMRRRQFGPKHF